MYIGIDIGGTHTRIAGSLSVSNINLIKKKTIATSQNFKDGIIEISKYIKEISNNTKGIGISIAGRVDKNGEKITHSGNLSGWNNKPILKTLENEFNCIISMENDAVAQALAEVHYGIKPNTNFLYLTWGTGVGGALVLQNGKEINSIKLGRSHLAKWEAKFGGKNIKKRFGKPANKLSDAQWDIVLLEFKNAIQSLSNTLKVEHVIIGGGIVDKQKDKLLEVLSNTYHPKILFSNLKENIGVYGGLALIKTILNS